MKSTLITLTTLSIFSSLALAAPAPAPAKQNPSSSAQIPIITVQFNGIDPPGEDAIQRDVPADNSVFSLGFVKDVFSAQIVVDGGLKNPSCLVFSDLKGTVSASEVSVTVDETVLLLGSSGAVKVGSVRCNSF